MEPDIWLVDGGPAFPIVVDYQQLKAFKGMTLLHYFAAAALTGAISNEVLAQRLHNKGIKITTFCYNIAREMIEDSNANSPG